MRPPSDETNRSPLHSLRAVITEQSEDDPLIGAKIGSQVALEMLLDQLATERGVHAETLMATAGVLVGLSVQASLWAEAQQAGLSRIPGLQLVRCRDDSRLLVGQPINSRLMEGYGSPWELLCEAARQEGCEALPAGDQLLLEGIQRIGTAAFGRPQVPASHTPELLEPCQQAALWRMFQPLWEGCCDEPAEWPLLGGLLAARALRLVSSTLRPDLALRLAMDCAIDAAKCLLSEPALAA